MQGCVDLLAGVAGFLAVVNIVGCVKSAGTKG